MKISGIILFREIQHFRMQWLWWLIILSMLSSIGLTIGLGLAMQEKTHEPWITLAFVIPFEIIIVYLFYITRLETIISTEGVFFKWWPFQRKYLFIPVKDIDHAYFRKGPGMRYGYHWTSSHGRVHNLAPGKGIQLVLSNRKKVFLGTQRLPAFQTAVEKIITVSQQV